MRSNAGNMSRSVILLGACLWLNRLPASSAFTGAPHVSFRQESSTTNGAPLRTWDNRLFFSPVQVQPEQEQSTLGDSVAKIRAEAERMRREAKALEVDLCRKKIQKISEKLSNQKWIQNHMNEKEKMEAELLTLQQKLEEAGPLEAADFDAVATSEKFTPSPLAFGGIPQASTYVSSPQQSYAPTKWSPRSTNNNGFEAPSFEDFVEDPQSTIAMAEVVVEDTMALEGSTSMGQSEDVSSSFSVTSPQATDQIKPKIPDAGFDPDDLEVYIPVAAEIEAKNPTATMEEKLNEFRASSELRKHFENKIRNMLKPVEELSKLESLRTEYLQSTSKVEKMNIKREMEAIEKKMEDDQPFSYSDSIFLNIAPMTEDELQTRTQAIEALPTLLQYLYKQRFNLEEEDEIRLAIQLDYYEQQLQLLEQIRFDGAVTESNKDDPRMAIESLPMSVRDHLAKKYGLSDGSNVDVFVSTLTNSDGQDTELSRIQELLIQSSADDDEYNDIEFIDRSRYVEEFYPALARLEEVRPSEQDMDVFVKEVLDQRWFQVRSRPERVIGGYYIRGYNSIDDDFSGAILTERLAEKLSRSSLKDRVQFFFLNDPEPLSEEDWEMEAAPDKVLFIAAKDNERLTDGISLIEKLGVNALGLGFMFVYSILTAESRPAPVELDGTQLSGVLSGAGAVFASLLATQVCHEVGHQIAAAQGNFTAGLPSIIPSVATGLGGAITPITSPPPNVKGLFDFAMAGPLAGFVASLSLLIFGLGETTKFDAITSQGLPALPLSLLKSSALGGGIIEAILGPGSLMNGVEMPPDAMLSLHPAAVGGFVGLMTSALALLPLGSELNVHGFSFLLSLFSH